MRVFLPITHTWNEIIRPVKACLAPWIAMALGACLLCSVSQLSAQESDAQIDERSREKESVATELADYFGVKPLAKDDIIGNQVPVNSDADETPHTNEPTTDQSEPVRPGAESNDELEITNLPPRDPVISDWANQFSWEDDDPLLLDLETGSDQPPADSDRQIFRAASFGQVENTEPWWRAEVRQPICNLPGAEALDVPTLIQLTLRGSRYLQAISQDPLIRELDEVIARAEFDPVLFAKTLYDDRTDPVGNALTTGGLPFLKDNIWTGQAGVRRKLLTGGQLEASQIFGFQNSNSRFFTPQDQGTATLAVNFQQPLLRGAGQCYNRGQVMIAQANAGASWDQVSAKIQDELTRAVLAYWDLYANRATLLQKQRNYLGGLHILERLEARVHYDAQALQIAQARAAVTSRKMELANALRDVRNAETELRRIVGDQQLAGSESIELLTIEPPVDVIEEFDLEQAVQTSLNNRPELRYIMQRLKAASLKCDVTRNEMLPDLTLLFGTYVKGLEGESKIDEAWKEQFTNSTPGYSLGMQYEFPRRNRAAVSRNRQSRLEMVRYQNELEQSTIDVIADTQQNYRRLSSGVETLLAARVALAASQAELNQVSARWDSFALVEGDWAEGQTQSLLLDQLLAAQQKVTTAEIAVTEAEREVKSAQIALRRAMGILLTYYQVSTNKFCVDGLPQVDYQVDAVPGQPEYEPGLSTPDASPALESSPNGSAEPQSAPRGYPDPAAINQNPRN